MFESFNESQATLVVSEPPTALLFSNSSVTNTTLLENGKPFLKISTTDPAGERTIISDIALGKVLATIQHRAIMADTITFTERFDGKALKLKDWLNEEALENGYQKWTIQTPAGNFVWRTDVSLRLALCPESNLDRPIAWAQLQNKTNPFGLILTQGTELFCVEIVASFIILEQRLRMKEKAYLRADGFVVLDRTVLGHQVNTGNFNRKG